MFKGRSKSMTSSREQTSQRKEDSDFWVHFIGKMEDSPGDSNKTTSFNCSVHKSFRNYLWLHFHLIFKSPFRNIWLPFYRCRNWVKESKLFSVSKQEANRAGGRRGGGQPPTFIFKLQISHCSLRASHTISKATERSLPISQNKPLISL